MSECDKDDEAAEALGGCRDALRIFRVAKDITRRLPATTEPLVLHVAIAAHPASDRLDQSERDLLYQVVCQDRDGSFPLPSRGLLYSKREWLRFWWNIEKHPKVMAVARRVSAWEGRLRSELGGMFDELYGQRAHGSQHPRARLKSMVDMFANHLRWEYYDGERFVPIPRNGRTPWRMRNQVAFFVLNQLDKLSEEVDILGQHWLYDRSLSAQQLVDRLRETPARYHVPALLRHIYDIVPPEHGREGMPSIYDICSGKASVSDYLAARQREALAREKSRHAQDRRLLEEISMVATLFASTTPHLPTISRALHALMPGARLSRSMSSNRDVCVLEGLSSHYRLYGPGRDGKDAALDAFMRFIGELRDVFAGGVNVENDDIWDVIYQLQNA